MNLVIITSNYPYGIGEEFLEDEIRIAEKFFSRIVLLSCGKSSIKTKKVPKNVFIIKCRKFKQNNLMLLFAFFDLFSRNTIREVYFSYEKLKFQSVFRNLKAIYLYYYINRILFPKLVNNKLLNSNTIYYSYWLGPGAFVLSKLKESYPDKFCIARAHGGDCFIDRGYQPFRREVLDKLDLVCPISEAGKKSIEGKLVPYTNKEKHSIKIHRLGVLKEESNLNPESNSNTLHLVSCSSIIPLKRIDMIIDALSELNSLSINWIHFGDGLRRNIIENYAKNKLGQKKNIFYTFCGHRSKTAILMHYSLKHVDLFVNCSDFEGIPVSIMEAFSYGIPVIARNVGGISEIVNSKNGMLLKSKCSAVDISSAIVNYWSLSTEKKRALSDSAYLTFYNNYNALKNYSNFFNTIIQAKETSGFAVEK